MFQLLLGKVHYVLIIKSLTRLMVSLMTYFEKLFLSPIMYLVFVLLFPDLRPFDKPCAEEQALT